VNISMSKRVSILVLFAGSCFGLASCSSTAAEVEPAFPANWAVVCTDESGDAKEFATLGESSGNVRLLLAADLEQAVVAARDVDENGIVMSLEIGVRIAYRNDVKESLPEYVEWAGGASQGHVATQQAAVTFRRGAESEGIMTTFEIEITAGGMNGNVILYDGGKIASFPASFKDGIYTAIVPLDGLSVRSTDEITIDGFSTWNMPEGFSFMASDTSSRCQIGSKSD